MKNVICIRLKEMFYLNLISNISFFPFQLSQITKLKEYILDFRLTFFFLLNNKLLTKDNEHISS
jgi:hypothetical protein